MKQSSLEITGQEYLIRLNKEDFELSFINQLLKSIHAEQLFFSRKSFYEETEDDMISRKPDSETFSRFDNLDEK